MSVLIWILGILALAAILIGLSIAEAFLIAAAVILLTTMGIMMSKADRADAPSGAEGPRSLLSAGTRYRLRLHQLRGFLGRRKT